MKVEYIDHMGNDLSVVNAAYASFGKRVDTFDEGKHARLIQYLARGMSNADYRKLCVELAKEITTPEFMAYKLEEYRKTPTHFSPFCHTAITLQLKAPIANHAQMMKHTVGFAHNTVSRRYVSDTPEFFVPEFREKPTGNVKQGSGDVIEVVTDIDGLKYSQDYLKTMYIKKIQSCIVDYEWLVSVGVSPEQARFVLPQGVLTEWVSTGSLYAWARFYNLRTDPHAQKEIQDLAKMVGEIIEPLYPVSWQALTRQSETYNG